MEGIKLKAEIVEQDSSFEEIFNRDTLPTKYMLNKRMGGLHVHVFIGTCLPKDLVEIEHMLKMTEGIFSARKKDFNSFN